MSLQEGLAAALATLPVRAGVAQLLAAEGRSLVIGRPANLRRWAAGQLGAGPPRKGGRPALDLSPIAVALRYAATASPFQQRLLFERLMAAEVPASARRDLKPPVFLHLDPGQRFPRLAVRTEAADPRHLFGPFLRRSDAEQAVQALNRRFRLRPCDFRFEPDPELPVGLGCLYAKTAACAAPCLARVAEAEYRALAAGAARFLAEDAAGTDGLPPWMGPLAESRGIVVDRESDGLRMYPVQGWRVLEEEARWTAPSGLEDAAGRLSWPEAPAGREDLAWLVSWLRSPGGGVYVPAGGRGGPAAGLREIMAGVP